MFEFLARPRGVSTQAVALLNRLEANGWPLDFDDAGLLCVDTAQLEDVGLIRRYRAELVRLVTARGRVH